MTNYKSPIRRRPMSVKKVKKDIFSQSPSISLVNYISADMDMSRGVAFEFNRRYSIRDSLSTKPL